VEVPIDVAPERPARGEPGAVVDASARDCPVPDERFEPAIVELE